MNKFRPILILSLFILFMVSLGAISAEELNSTVVNDAPAMLIQMQQLVGMVH